MTVCNCGDVGGDAADASQAMLVTLWNVAFAAGGVIVTAPLLFRIPGLRRYPLIRALELVGGAALLIKAAEAIRDWDASGRHEQRIVIDV